MSLREVKRLVKLTLLIYIVGSYNLDLDILMTKSAHNDCVIHNVKHHAMRLYAHYNFDSKKCTKIQNIKMLRGGVKVVG